MLSWTLILMLSSQGSTAIRALDASMSFPTEESCKAAAKKFLDVASPEGVAMCLQRLASTTTSGPLSSKHQAIASKKSN